MTEKQHRSATRVEILNVAEKICARSGFEGLSVRAIAEEAKVNIAALNYHFGTKQQLFIEMFERRVEPINAERVERLEACISKPGGETLEDIIEAFVAPPMRLTSLVQSNGDSALVVMQFLSRKFSMPGETDFLEKYYEPVRSRFLLALRRQLPDLPQEELVWRYNIMVGMIVYAMAGADRMTRLPAVFGHSAAPAKVGLEDAVGTMVNFVAAGFRAASGFKPAAPAPARKRRVKSE
jgi:AcrR family transcriptional regulator